MHYCEVSLCSQTVSLFLYCDCSIYVVGLYIISFHLVTLLPVLVCKHIVRGLWRPYVANKWMNEWNIFLILNWQCRSNKKKLNTDKQKTNCLFNHQSGKEILTFTLKTNPKFRAALTSAPSSGDWAWYSKQPACIGEMKLALTSLQCCVWHAGEGEGFLG